MLFYLQKIFVLFKSLFICKSTIWGGNIFTQAFNPTNSNKILLISNISCKALAFLFCIRPDTDKKSGYS